MHAQACPCEIGGIVPYLRGPFLGSDVNRSRLDVSGREPATQIYRLHPYCTASVQQLDTGVRAIKRHFNAYNTAALSSNQSRRCAANS